GAGTAQRAGASAMDARVASVAGKGRAAASPGLGEAGQQRMAGRQQRCSA
nr:hypothetical protein [Tanacetum cinerariifolium]